MDQFITNLEFKLYLEQMEDLQQQVGRERQARTLIENLKSSGLSSGVSVEMVQL